VTAAEEGAVFVKERGADGDAAFGEAEASFVEGDAKHVTELRFCVTVQLDFHGIRLSYCSENTARRLGDVWLYPSRRESCCR
jgi:hypothetical protein